MQTLTLNEISQVSGGKRESNWGDRFCSDTGSSQNTNSSSWGDNFVRSWRTIADNTPDMHDRAVRALTDVMCRITGNC